jgi:2-dehydro-3-deoxyglucarate aldolase/4-hydroxy-2-oxoheptanedioate aldolase
MNNESNNAARESAPFLGTWLSVGSPVIAELAAASGFDWLLIDMEHGCGSEYSLFSSLQAMKGTKAQIIVRVGAPHPEFIMKVLDWGADGIMVPHISSAREAEDCVLAVNYPPLGHRGMSRSVRVYNYGLTPPSIKQPMLIVQIETIEGVQNVEAIAAQPGVDCLFVGPADLNFDLSHREHPKELSYENCLQRVVSATKAAHKKAGILVRNMADQQPLYRMGFTHLAIDSDLGILRGRYQQLVAQKTALSA